MIRAIQQTQIYILDDHQLIRDGLSSLISQDKKFTIAGTADSCSAALKDLAVITPDIMIVDITLKDGNGIDFIKTAHIKYPAIKFLVLSMHDENSYAERAMKAGASGYVMKQEASERIIDALRVISAGEIYLSEKIKTKVLSQFVRGKPEPHSLTPESALADREFEIFRMIGEGKVSRIIAEELGISMKTVEAHKEHIREKLGIESGNGLIIEAVTWKLKNNV